MRKPKPFAGESFTTPLFWKKLRELPSEVQRQARATHKQWKVDTTHPALRFKRVHTRRPIYSVRVNIDVRAVGVKKGTDMVWFWIGSHDEYESLLDQLS